jgi:hypothetical protein
MGALFREDNWRFNILKIRVLKQKYLEVLCARVAQKVTQNNSK